MTRSTSSLLPQLVRFTTLLIAAGALIVGCGTDGKTSTEGGAPADPAHYRDFETADRLSAYLRSDALPLIGAHRGGPATGYPENALATFAHSLTHGPVLLETDVRMTEDSVLVLMHDETLGRTTTGSGPVRDRTLSDLRTLRLVTDSGNTTRYQVPTVAEALAWAEGRAVLQLDVKEDVPRSLVTDLLRRMDALDQALVITYALEDARWYHRRMPELLLSVSAETREEAVAHLEQIEPSRLVAFAGVGTPSEEVLSVFSNRNVPVTVGTFGDLDRQARQRGLVVYRDLFRQGVDVIATDETALASQAAATYQAPSTGEERP
jgi:glycerophosphoryl diester phosphodiesterase